MRIKRERELRKRDIAGRRRERAEDSEGER